MMRGTVDIITGDCRATLRNMPEQSVNCCVTSPPYFGLRDYGHDDQIGLEPTPDEFVAAMVAVFRDVRRVLRDDGTLWLNLGDCYGPDKCRRLIPARVAIALVSDGWVLRDEIIWHKPRTTPAPVIDRTVAAHETIHMFTKKPRYYYDWASIEEPAKHAGETRQKAAVFNRLTTARSGTKNNGQTFDEGRIFTVRETRRKRSVWSVSPSPFKGAHFATFPPDLIEPCILAGCPEGGTVLDPFGGAGTTGLVAARHGRNAVLCELNPEYAAMARDRIDADTASPLERAKRKAKPANDNGADLFAAA